MKNASKLDEWTVSKLSDLYLEYLNVLKYDHTIHGNRLIYNKYKSYKSFIKSLSDNYKQILLNGELKAIEDACKLKFET